MVSGARRDPDDDALEMAVSRSAVNRYRLRSAKPGLFH